MLKARETLPAASWNKCPCPRGERGEWALLQTRQVAAVSWIEAEAGDSGKWRFPPQLYYILAVRRGGSSYSASLSLTFPVCAMGLRQPLGGWLQVSRQQSAEPQERQPLSPPSPLPWAGHTAGRFQGVSSSPANRPSQSRENQGTDSPPRALLPHGAG